MPKDSSDLRAMTATQKQAEAMRLRASGKSLAAIAKAVGYRSESGAHKAIVSGLKKTLKEPADELRTLEAERLDRMLEGIWEKATNGGTWEIDRVIAIMDRRARLIGLDKPPTEDIGEKMRMYLDLLEAAQHDAVDMSE
jgi:hypothetical protein